MWLRRVLPNLVNKRSCFPAINSLFIRHSSLWEPDYLILAKTKTPEYDLLNVQIKGYDFVVLESFQRRVHTLAKKLEIVVNDAWATPRQSLVVQKYKMNSSITESEYKLHLYERNVQLADPKGHVLQLFLELLATSCPPGIRVCVLEHTFEQENIRYIPDHELLALKDELKTRENVKRPKTEL